MLFDGTYARGDVAGQTSVTAWLQALLDVEAALATACAEEGLIAARAAERITGACRAEQFDVIALTRAAGDHATVVVPLVAALRERVGVEDAAAVHLGATSQDILDTAAMLLSRRSLRPLLADARAAAAAAARLADRHRATPMIGRTLLAHAMPVSFGLRAAGWTVGIDEAVAELESIDAGSLAVQMGGPVGTRDPTIAARVAARLGLAEPVLPWHAIRGRVARLAGGLGQLAGVIGKVARDATLLSADDVGELREGGGARGRSSAMAHKRNPVAAVSALACAKRTPGLVATLLATMEQEHERAAGAWQAEWGTLTELLVLTGSATAWTRDLLEHLEVDDERMLVNLGRLADAGIPEARDPTGTLAAAGRLIDRALTAHRAVAAPRGATP